MTQGDETVDDAEQAVASIVDAVANDIGTLHHLLQRERNELELLRLIHNV